MTGEDDCPSVTINLKKARKSWAQMTRILGREGANLRVSGMLFNAVVQEVLLLGVGDVGHDPLHVTDPGQFSTQGCTTDHWEAADEGGVGGLGLSTADNSYGGGGI